jgi:kynurenine formamidase
MKVAFWDHPKESHIPIGDTHFRGYAVKGISPCDHDSTHMDAVYHLNPERPDLTVDAFPGFVVLVIPPRLIGCTGPPVRVLALREP